MTTFMTPATTENTTLIPGQMETAPTSIESKPEQPDAAVESSAPAPDEVASTQVAQATSEQLQRRLQLLGSITWLMLQSPQHRFYPLAELEARIIPSLMLNQFRYYEIDGQPIGFVNWAYLSEEVESQYQEGDFQLSAEDWRSGERLWAIDFVDPFEQAQNMVDDLQRNIFPEGTTAKTIQVKHDGTRAIVEYMLGPES